MLSEKQREKNAKKFSQEWKNRGNEKSEAQKFWFQLLRDVYGVNEPEKYIDYEEKVKLDRNAFIDGHIKRTNTFIEQKSLGIDLNEKIRQSDGKLLTAFEQIQRYTFGIKFSERPRWIITCNFSEFYIYDLENPNNDATIIKLENLCDDYYKMDFLIDPDIQKINNEVEVSLQAGQIVGELYDVFEQIYRDNNIENYEKHLNKLCVRIVFCLYAEDSGLFGKRNMFRNYLENKKPSEIHSSLKKLFKILNTPEKERDPFEDEDVNAFPYVNGGLFVDDDLIIPFTNDKIKNLLLAKASDEFDWSRISPTIFGGVFESTLNQETRRSGGMHFTSIENIHKVIDPLFLNDLKDELNEIKKLKQISLIKDRVKVFQDKLQAVRMMDPACGSGNFLTESYLSLRRLENEALACEKLDGSIEIFADPVKVSISQFFGIEINDFAVEVAKTALWIAENQMNKETEKLFNININKLPLTTNAFIVCDNALTCNWNSIATNKEIRYVLGNPPFIGASNMTKIQKKEMLDVFNGMDKYGDLDYVTAWYEKASDYIKDTNIRCSFVSTNSICQGEQVGIIWKHLLENKNIEIDYAYRTFRWDNQTSDMAHVHCVIIGFSYRGTNKKDKVIYEDNDCKKANNINGYLLDGKNIYIEAFSKPLSNIEKMIRGSSPCDNGNYSFDEKEKDEFINSNPQLEKYIKQFVGAKEFINSIKRYCIWLYNADPKIIKSSKELQTRIDNVVEFRKQSKKEQTRELANTPLEWEANRYNGKDFILIPRVSSEKREYIPIGFMNGNVIANDAVQLVPNASLYEFGILTSKVHMIWMRLIAGRLENRYRYSNLVYNSFIWPDIDESIKKNIEMTAGKILEVRNKYPNSSLADLYDSNIMPKELREAHKQNDKAVLKAYSMKENSKDDEVLKKLFSLYEKMKNSKK